MSDPSHAAIMVERALAGSAAAAGCVLRIESANWTRWSSASFAGARGKLTLAGTASIMLDQWLGQLAKAELELRGHLIAELTIRSIQKDGSGAEIELEVLTVET